MHLSFSAQSLRLMKESELDILRKAERVEQAETTMRGMQQQINLLHEERDALASWFREVVAVCPAGSVPRRPLQNRLFFLRRADFDLPDTIWLPFDSSQSQSGSDNESESD